MKHIVLSLLWLFANPILFAQNNDSNSCKISKTFLWAAYGTAYTASMTTLYFAWYDGYHKTAFHWFDDAAEWQQMDKMGHTFTAYQLTRLTHKPMLLTGYNRQQSLFIIIGRFFTLLMNSIELFDEYSEKWGA